MGFLLAIVIVAASIGAFCAILGKGRMAVACAGVVPWLAMLGFLLYVDHVASAHGFPAIFDQRTVYWPEQQLYLGTFVAVFGVLGDLGTRKIGNRGGGRGT